jgi:hypothetical protein
VTIGVGLTVTVTLNELPWQEPAGAVGVTEYTTLIGAFVVFVKVPDIVVAFVPDDNPVIPTVVGDDQL